MRKTGWVNLLESSHGQVQEAEEEVNAEKAAKVCELVAEGQSLRAACEAVGVKNPTFLLWCDKDAALAEQYARAREKGIDAEFERLQEAVEEPPERGPSGGVDAGWVAWKRLQVDTKKWALSKKAPKKYGDKIDHNVSGTLSFSKITRQVVDPT